MAGIRMHRIGSRRAGARALLRLWVLAKTGRSVAGLLRVEALEPSAEAEGWSAPLNLLAGWMCLQVGEPAKGLVRLDRALAAGPALSAAEFAAAHAVKAWLLLETGALEQAVDAATRAAELADLSADLRARSLAANVLGVIFWGARLGDRAVELCSEAVQLARDAGDTTLECWWLVNVGGANWVAATLAEEAGRAEEAARFFEASDRYTRAALQLARQLGDTWTERLCLGNLADSAANLGQLEEADALLGQYLALGTDLPLRDREHFLDVLAILEIKRGRFEAAIRALEEGRRLAEQSGNAESLLHAALHLSMAHEGLGRLEEALAEYKLYHRLHQQLSAERARRTARLADVALEADRLRRQAAHLAQSVDRDPLTGAYNRRRLDIELAAVAADRRGFALAMIDLDWFKSVNDRFGHAAGDVVLREAAVMLAEAARAGDIVARYGGEEFVLLGEGDDDALARLDDLRRRFERHDWSHVAPGLRLTISIGLAFSFEAPDADNVLKLADARLYAAKRTGRNRLVATTPPATRLQQAG